MKNHKKSLSGLLAIIMTISLLFGGFSTAFAAGATLPVIGDHLNPTYGLSAHAYDGFNRPADGYGDYIDTFFSVNEAVYTMDVTAYAGDPTDASVPTLKITGSKDDPTQIGLSTNYDEANNIVGNEWAPNSTQQMDTFFTALKFAVNPKVKIIVTNADGNTAQKIIDLVVSINAVTDVTRYNAALATVSEATYTVDSWTAYQTIVSANAVTATSTQAEVNAFTAAIVTAQGNLVRKSNIATVISNVYNVSIGGTANETITDVTYGTSREAFLAGLTKRNDATWNITAISDVVVSGDKLVVTAQDGTQVTYTITVNAAPDTTKPAAPTGLTGIAGDAEVKLTWTTNAETDIAGYNIYQDENKVANTTFTELVLTGLVNGINYNFQVTAVDRAGNESFKSAPVTATPIERHHGGGPTPQNVADISTKSNILLVGDYAFDLNVDAATSGYNLNNFLIAAQTAYTVDGGQKYHIYFKLDGEWYDLVDEPTLGHSIPVSSINGNGTYAFMNMQ